MMKWRIWWLLFSNYYTSSLTLFKNAAGLSRPLFKFGIISDIQYAESEDSWNFHQTKIRRYSNSLKIFQEAVQVWSQEEVNFALILGDIVDIRASLSQTQQSCKRTLLKVAEQFPGSKYYCFGNHCLTCFPRLELRDLMRKEESHLEYFVPSLSRDDDPTVPLCYYWNPVPSWCFISLDGYDVSFVGSSNKENQDYAKRLIKQHNPNDLSLGSGWFEGLPKEKTMWTPNNGAVSREQLVWLDSVLRKTEELQQKVVIFSHQPVYSPLNPTSLIWNYDEVLSVLWKFNHIVLWLAGHDHEGQSYLDQNGIHHIVPPAPIECNVGDTSYGLFEVYDDSIRFDWRGSKPRRNCPHPWPKHIPIDSSFTEVLI